MFKNPDKTIYAITECLSSLVKAAPASDKGLQVSLADHLDEARSALQAQDVMGMYIVVREVAWSEDMVPFTVSLVKLCGQLVDNIADTVLEYVKQENDFNTFVADTVLEYV